MSEKLKIFALGLLLGISMAPGDDIVQLLGHERLFGIVALHGNMVMGGEQEALFIEASIEDSPMVHTRDLGEAFGVRSPMTSVLAPLGNDCSREAPKSLLVSSTADEV